MKILADENVEGHIVRSLRQSGYDVSWICESYPGIDDARVRELAKERSELFISSDLKLIAQLAAQFDTTHGTLLLRLGGMLPDDAAKLVLDALQTKSDWNSYHSVLSPSKLRSRRRLEK